jgi:hypothetical protein
MSRTLGADFAQAMAAKDHEQLRALLHEEIDFRAMTPSRVWEADCPDEVVGAVSCWFSDTDLIEEAIDVQTDGFADCERVGYRFRVRSDNDTVHLVEQQAYLSERDGQIGWLRIMCAGYRPLSAPTPEPA